MVEVGGPPYLLPLVKREKVYDVRDVAKLTNTNPAFIIGAGAGPHPYAGCNCEVKTMSKTQEEGTLSYMHAYLL